MENDQVDTRSLKIPPGVKFIFLFIAYLVLRWIYVLSYPGDYSQYSWDENMMRPILAAFMLLFLGTIFAGMALMYLIAYASVMIFCWAVIQMIVDGGAVIKQEALNV